jgi:Tfp pilus assembly protein PilZ
MWQWNFEERRKFPRYEVSLFLKNSSLNSQKETEAYTHDISAQGIGLFTSKELPKGDSLDIRLYMPDNNEQVCTRGTVVWLSSVGPCKYRAGIKLEGAELKPVPMVLKTIAHQIRTRYYYLQT